MSETGLIVFFILIPLIVLWAALLIDLVRRDDIGPAKKVLWAAFTLITAEFGAFVYIAMRPLRYPEDGVAPGADNRLAAELLGAAESADEGVLAASKETVLQAIE